MKISLVWLRQFVDIPAEPEVFGQKITHVGLAVDSREGVEDDTIYELDVTTNRPDCLSHLGVARETAAIFGTTLRRPRFTLPEATDPAAKPVLVSVDDPELCGRYCGRYIRGVKDRLIPAVVEEEARDAGRPVDQQRYRRDKLRDAGTRPAAARI
jgi:phenylalanyl-tRNA synthetase beta chain